MPKPMASIGSKETPPGSVADRKGTGGAGAAKGRVTRAQGGGYPPKENQAAPAAGRITDPLIPRPPGPSKQRPPAPSPARSAPAPHLGAAAPNAPR